MRKLLVAGNWKMHGRLSQNEELMNSLFQQLPALSESIDILVCPPSIYLDQIKRLVDGRLIGVGAQNVSCFELDGAHTGEYSASMLADLGVSYVLIGHSERRSEQHESNDQVAIKLKNALKAGLVPLLCVGETLAEREAGLVENVIADQLSIAFAGLDSDELSRVVVAYEPVWAIGTGKTATPEQAQHVHAYIREFVAGGFGSELSLNMKILYGGSVKAANAEELFKQPDIDGGLIGGAALVTEEFTAICRAAANSPKYG